MNEQLGKDLFPRLSSAVEEIQIQVVKGYSVIWNCSAVDELCFCMEDIFSHGLKEGLLSWASNNQVSFWSLATKITCKNDIEDILRLRLKTDQEKCMAWIRQGLKENTLGSYINVLTQDEKLLREFYQPHAFLCDREKAERTKNLISYGISHLDFDISLTSSSTQSVEEGATTPLIADSDRPSLVNGCVSPSTPSSWKGHEHSVHLYNLQSGSSGSERTGRKKKKRKKAEVVMIAESVDSDEIQRDLDSEGSDEEIKETMSLNTGHDSTSAKSKGDFTPTPPAVVLDSEGDNGSVISLTMELPVTETVLQQIITDKRQQLSPSGVVSGSDQVVPNAVESEQETVSVGSATSENMYGERVIESKADEKSKDSDTRMGDLREVIDGNTALQSPRFRENVVEGAIGGIQIETECHPTCQNLGQKALEGETNSASDEGAEERTLTADNNSGVPEYYAALAAFECGTPKQVDSIWEIERSGEQANAIYENKDFNIVPGIHKSYDTRSPSSSGSFNGSGSFQSGSQRSSKGYTLESNCRSSPPGSNVPPSSWPGDLSRKSSGGDVTIGSPSSEGQFSEYEMFDELLALEEDHFSPPESFMGVTTSEELQHAIAACKDLINTTSDDREEKKKLVTKLVQLRLKLQETQDSKHVGDSNVQKVLGHTFSKEEERGKKLNCDRCGKTVWMWQSLFTCSACKYRSHKQCLELIRRACASRKVSISTYNLRICPEPGLSSQQYKCAECRKQIGLIRTERSEARLCDYSGQYFCDECHWNDVVVIPARVVHNWDFSLYKVSRQSKQLLALMTDRPLLKIEKLNPALFKFVVELREVKRLREETLVMKKYFVTCRQALESKLLLQLKDRQHFVESSNIYSLQDLIDVNSGLLLPFLTKIHSLFLAHIKSDCQLCQAKGFVCEFCGKDEIIFAFDPHSTQCKQCRTVFHKICFKSGVCPKCQRRQKRSQTIS